ncbi:glycosyltransferase [Vibrio cortegadensis]|uniref:glycosyltransferase n=1 Tax=Vibrio cortegadensis TaxID=1328770 RepID=UPI00352E0D13
MHICFVTHGSIEKIATMKRATGMANHLLKVGCKVTIICSDLPENESRIGFECPEVNVEYVSPGSAISELVQKNKLIRKIKPDLVYVCSIGIRNLVFKSITSKTKFVVEHSELPSIFLGKNSLSRTKELILEFSSLFLYDAHICASRFLEKTYTNRMKKVCVRKPILYSPYAYNSETLTPDKETVSLSENDSNNNTKVILYMGTLTENYGLFDMLNSVMNISKKRSDINLLIMGNGRDKKKAVDYIERKNLNDYVTLLGYVPEDDLSYYFNVADVFISPLHNTLQDIARCPSKLFMYLPFDKPIITCEVGEAKELFGGQGIYYKPGDVDSLVCAIESSLGLTKPIYSSIKINSHSWESRTNSFMKWINEEVI